MDNYLNYLIDKLTRNGYAIEIEITDGKSRIHLFKPGDEKDTAVIEDPDWVNGVRSLSAYLDDN